MEKGKTGCVIRWDEASWGSKHRAVEVAELRIRQCLLIHFVHRSIMHIQVKSLGQVVSEATVAIRMIHLIDIFVFNFSLSITQNWQLLSYTSSRIIVGKKTQKNNWKWQAPPNTIYLPTQSSPPFMQPHSATWVINTSTATVCLSHTFTISSCLNSSCCLSLRAFGHSSPGCCILIKKTEN